MQAQETRRGRPRGPAKKHIGVMMPEGLWERVQAHALASGKTLSHIVAEGTEAFLDSLEGGEADAQEVN